MASRPRTPLPLPLPVAAGRPASAVTVATVAKAALALVLLAGLGTACDRTPPPPAALDLFFTSQTHGRITPCGCFTGQFGGISRLPAALALEGLTNAVGVDAGDALEGTEDFHRLRHRKLATAFASLGYVALNAGRMEASLPAPALRQLAADSPVPLISANILDRSTGKPLLAPWRVLQRDGLRIAFIGLVDPRGFDDGPGEGLEIERMETCLARILPEVRRAADVIAVLAHTDEATLTSLASEFYEIALILGGRVSQPAQSLLKENRTLIHYTGNEGKSFGALRLEIARPDGAVGVRHSSMVLLTDRIPEDPAILALATDYRREVRAATLAIDDPGRALEGRVPASRPRNGFAGTDSCLSCHAAAAKVWERSQHARAFTSLADRDSDADPSCIGCHTIGFGAPDGYRREYGKTRLVDVGCESCHGPGALHVAERKAATQPPSFKFRPLAAGDCQKCHHGEFSRPFDWNRFWPPVQH